MQPASISSRFAAMNLDMLIYGALWQGGGILIENNAPEFATLTNLSLLSLVFAFIYFVWPTKISGQTLGKKLLSLKVVPREGGRLPLTWRQVFVREIVGKSLSTIPLFLGYAWAYLNMDHKAWHDSMSGTQVVSLVWEEEKSGLQKFQQLMLGILSIPLGVALVLGTFLYTSLPLDSIKEKIEAAGIQVGSLTGSLAGGLQFSEIRRHDENQSFSLASVSVKFNLSALIYERAFIIEKITAEEGHIEVPEDFSWATVFVNLMAVGQPSQNGGGLKLGNFKMARMYLKNIFFEHNKKVLSQLQELSVKNLEMADAELRIGEAQFQIPGFRMKTLDFKSAFGRIEVASATGGMGPEFLPILKVPVDFHVKGSIGKNPKGTKFDGGMTIDKIKFNYDGGRLVVTADKLLLNEMFKTALPLEDLDMKLSAEGQNALDFMSSLNVEYGLKVCGNEFKADPERGTSFHRDDRQFDFKMVPKPIENLGQVIFAKDSTLDSLFFYEVHGRKQMASNFANHQEMVSDLCMKKPLAELQPQELENLKPLIAATDTVATGASLQALLSKSVPITVSSPAVPGPTTSVAEAPVEPLAEVSPTPTPTPAPAPSPVVTPTMATAEQVRTAMSEAGVLFRSGKFAEAKAVLDGVQFQQEALDGPEAGSFYNLRAWVHLYVNDPKEAAQSFEQAFNARKSIGDAEGLLRANEELKNEAEVSKWLEYIKTTLKEQPNLKSHLSPNMQKRFSSEAAEESRP